jgi:hypothetical protein
MVCGLKSFFKSASSAKSADGLLRRVHDELEIVVCLCRCGLKFYHDGTTDALTKRCEYCVATEVAEDPERIFVAAFLALCGESYSRLPCPN